MLMPEITNFGDLVHVDIQQKLDMPLRFHVPPIRGLHIALVEVLRARKNRATWTTDKQ